MRSKSLKGRGRVWVDFFVDSDGAVHSPACLEYEHGRMLGASNGCAPGAERLPGYMLIPALCNAHIHVLDAAIADAGEELGLSELVAQPRGLKYRLLASASSERLLEAVTEALGELEGLGVGYAGVYAEMGDKGAGIVAEAASRVGVRVLLLVQPLEKRFPEALSLASRWGGLGLDTPLDFEYWELRQAAEKAVIHAHVSEDAALNRVLDYASPNVELLDAAIHLTHLTPGSVIELASIDVHPIFCPYSNLYHQGMLPPLAAIPLLYSERLPAGFGSDNAAWNTVDPLREALLAYLALRHSSVDRGLLLEALFYTLTAGCRKLLGLEEGLYTLKRVPLASYTSNPIAALIKRGSGQPALALLENH